MCGTIRANSELLVQITTEACGQYSLEQQMATVRNLKVDAASYALREFFPGERVEPRVVEFFAWVTGLGVGGQFILYTAAERDRLQALVARGIIPVKRPHALFVLPRHGFSKHSDPADLHAFLQGWPPAGDAPADTGPLRGTGRDISVCCLHSAEALLSRLVEPLRSMQKPAHP